MSIPSSAERMRVQRSEDYPFLESLIGPPAPYNSPRHLHEELEIALNPDRPWHYYCRGATYHVPPDVVLFTPPEEPHAVSSLEKGSSYYFGLRIHPEFLESTISEMAERPHTLPLFSELLVDDATFSYQLLTLHSSLWEERNSRLEQDALLQHIVLRLLRQSTSRLSWRPPGSEPGAVGAARMYLQEHYWENVSLQQLAEQVHLSAFYFSRIFQSAVGFPPHAYQTQIRILHAKELLRKNIPLAEAAKRTGFHSQSHLGWHFKRLVGITPGEYAHDCHL